MRNNNYLIEILSPSIQKSGIMHNSAIYIHMRHEESNFLHAVESPLHPTYTYLQGVILYFQFYVQCIIG